METKKSRKANLENKRPLFFELGLIIALALTLIAFEWSGSSKTDINCGTMDDLTLEEEVAPITRQQEIIKPPPPPPRPKVAEVLNIVDDGIEIENELIIADAEADQETEFEIRNYVEMPMVEEEIAEEVFFIVEEMPRFNGKEKDEFRKFIGENLHYPEIAAENGITGTIYIQFIINRNGQVTDVEVVRSVDPALDNEAVRVISSSPKWTPGKQRGRPVSVRFTFPIHFILQQ